MGPSGFPAGPTSIVAADTSLTGGTSTGLSRSVLTIEAETCTGDPAASSELFVRTTGGVLDALPGTPFEHTGTGKRMTLGPDGAGVVEIDVADFLFGGDITIFAAASSAMGSLTLPAYGDSVAPRIRSVSPVGRVTLATDRFEVKFNEAMLTSVISAEPSELVQIYSAGELVELRSVHFEDPYTLHVELDDTVLFFDGQIAIFDEFRDEAGNRVDGDRDGTAGGTWFIEFGDVPDAAPSLSACSTSVPLFRPDGDNGEGVEADSIRIDVQTTGESHRITAAILDTEGTWHAGHEIDIGMSRTGSFSWDGRDAGGQVVDNGVYFVEIAAIDEHRNAGAPCTVGVRVDNR